MKTGETPSHDGIPACWRPRPRCPWPLSPQNGMVSDNGADEIVETWCAELHRQGRSHLTIAAYRRALDHFRRWTQSVYGQDLDPARVTPRDVRDWKAHQQTAERAAPASVNQRLAALSRYFHWAVRRRLAPDDPTEDVPALRLPPSQPKALSSGDLRRLLREARGEARDYALLEVLAGTGLRVGELLALRVGDVEMNERAGRLTVRMGKHGGYRNVPLTLDVRKALAAYLTQYPEPDNPDAPLWLAQDGLALARRLGHASLNTVRVYTEPDMDDLAQRMERVEVEE